MKRCIIIVFSLLTASLLYSQTPSLSLSTGLSLSSSLNSGSYKINSKSIGLGSYLGFSSEMQLNTSLSLGAGIEYRFQNYKLEKDSPFSWGTDFPIKKSILITHFQSHTMSVNLFVAYKIRDIHSLGLKLSYLYSAKSSTDSYELVTPESTDKINYKDGSMLDFNKNNYAVDLIYSIAPFTSGDIKNLSFSLAYSINVYSDSAPILELNTLRYSILAGVNYMFLD